MKGAIILPAVYKKRHATGHLSMVSKVLFDLMKEKYGFSLLYSNSPNLKGLDVAIIYSSHRFENQKVPTSILNAKGVKIINYYGDLPCYGNKKCLENRRLMLEKCDIAMGGYSEYFATHYSKYVNKYRFFPGRFYPYERYINLQVNPNPVMKCLLSGHINRFYPFRAYIKTLYKRNTGGLKGMLSIKGRWHVPFENYPAFLNTYFCAIATSGMHACMVGKYFEIPAAGALLLAKREKELDRLGYEPYVHYVPITKQNVVSQIQKVLTNPNDYNEMRHVAMKFVHNNHSDLNRMKQFEEILNELNL